MREKLDNNYIISYNNIVDIQENYPGWKINNAEFAKGYNKTVSKQILVQGDNQIMLMKDGNYILEIDNSIDCDYFYSKDINDLL